MVSIVLTDEQARIEHEKQRALYAEALEDTLRLYPNTDPMALITFQVKIGCGAGMITEDDLKWAREQIASFPS